MEDMDVLIIQTGGTIDKDYPRRSMGYAFEITEPAVERILKRIKPTFNFTVTTLCREDSQNISQIHRKSLLEMCKHSSSLRILVTHGTDTMIESAKYLAEHDINKVIIFTGAFKPETFKDSDADFNTGFALGAMQCLTEPGVYVAMNGRVYNADLCKKDELSGNFVTV